MPETTKYLFIYFKTKRLIKRLLLVINKVSAYIVYVVVMQTAINISLFNSFKFALQ